jgi:hypothetical protein
MARLTGQVIYVDGGFTAGCRPDLILVTMHAAPAHLRRVYS